MSIDFDTPVRILQLDLPEYADRARLHLHRAGLSFMILRVEAPDAFDRALRTFAPDIVVANAVMPQLGADGVLDRCHERHPGLPVVFVGPTTRDGSAIRLILSGAADYVVREHLAQLPVALHRALSRRAALLPPAAALRPALHAA